MRVDAALVLYLNDEEIGVSEFDLELPMVVDMDESGKATVRLPDSESVRLAEAFGDAVSRFVMGVRSEGEGM